MSKRSRWLFIIWAVAMIVAGVIGVVDGGWYGWLLIASGIVALIGLVRVSHEQRGNSP
jgi:ABC-type xylose transport system permease subunit